jgi:hypothetical protein
MKYIKTTYEAYQQYLEKHKTDRIQRGVKLITSKFSNKHKLYEITYIPKPTEFEFKTISTDIYLSHFVYIFECDSKNKYILELIEIKPENFWYDSKHFSVSFSLLDREDKFYDEPTNLGELYEVFQRLLFLLEDFNGKNENVVYVIGNPLDKRKELLYLDFIHSFNKNYIIKTAESSYFKGKGDSYYIKLI